MKLEKVVKNMAFFPQFLFYVKKFIFNILSYQSHKPSKYQITSWTGWIVQALIKMDFL